MQDRKTIAISEIVKIIEDVITIFNNRKSPILIILGSSYFTTYSFSDSELVVFSEEDPKLLSKSPYLPLDTSIQYERVSGDVFTSFHRVVYAKKQNIESWIKVASQLKNPLIALTTPCVHIIESISKIIKSKVIVVCDIGISVTTLFFQKEDCELFSSRLPYGASVYVNEDKEIQLRYFERLRGSINTLLIEKDLNCNHIYCLGRGLDLFRDSNLLNDYGLKSISEIPEFAFECSSNNAKEQKNANQSVLSLVASTAKISLKK